jgi:hypothetical protein
MKELEWTLKCEAEALLRYREHEEAFIILLEDHKEETLPE